MSSALRDFFQDCVDQDQRERDYYKGLMQKYSDYAELKLGAHAEFVAYAFLDGIKRAKEVFNSLGLRAIHAYAIQSHLNDFTQEFDDKEKNEQDYED